MGRHSRLVPVAFAAAGLVAIGIACGSSSQAPADDGGVGAESGVPSEGGGEEFDGPATTDSSTSFIVDSGVVDTGLPLNRVDAAGTPEGGRAVTPGVIACGADTCNAFASVQCCLSGNGGTCMSTAVACPAGSAATTCNELADCVVGTLCCGAIVAFDGGGGGLAASCSSTCAAPRPRLCRTNAECPDGGPCVRQACSDGYEYEFCGVYAPAPLPGDAGSPFTCAPN
jgi:hypothetical protein